MTKRRDDHQKPWLELLRESVDFVQAEGGLFALDLEYYTDRKRKQARCYRLLWTNRLAAETKSGRLMRHEGGVLRTGPLSETMSAVAEALAALRQIRERQHRPVKRAAAQVCMIYIEPIIRRKFSQPDRAAVQEQVCLAVEANPDRFLAAYHLDSRSFQGRYVNSDLMKEMFSEYNASKEHRSRYNLPLHNAAAVLASAQFRAAIADDSVAERTNALSLTGVPGAGKTAAVLANRDQFPQDTRILYEGQLSDPVNAIPKFAVALGCGLDVEIVAIHVLSEQALANTILRFEREGRGATIEALARIQGYLPNGLKQIHAHFGEKIGVSVLDKRDMIRVRRLRGWEAISLLESEGNYEHIKRKLTEILEAQYAAHLITHRAYKQALGQAAAAVD